MRIIVAAIGAAARLALRTRMAWTTSIELAAMVFFFFRAMATKKLLP